MDRPRSVVYEWMCIVWEGFRCSGCGFRCCGTEYGWSGSDFGSGGAGEGTWCSRSEPRCSKRWMSNWYRVGVDLGAIELAPSLLAQACIPTEHGPRIFASGGRSSLEEVVLEALWKRLATLGPGYGPPSFFIHSDFLSVFFSFLKMPLNRGVGPRPRGRVARTRKRTSKGD